MSDEIEPVAETQDGADETAETTLGAGAATPAAKKPSRSVVREPAPKIKKRQPKKAKGPRDDTPTEVYMVRGFFPPDGGPKLHAGTFPSLPAWMVVKLASRGIVMDPDEARREIDEGKAEAVLRRERGKYALARQETMLTAPVQAENWLEE